jgi:hypothetical protein
MPSHPPKPPQPIPALTYPHDLIYPPVPKTGTTSAPKFDIKSFVRNIFHANPLFLRFCIDTVLLKAPNSKQAKLLAKSYQNINRGISMPVHSHVRACTHIKVSGVRCGSPAMRGEQFCYFHQRLIRGVAMPPRPRLLPIAMIEDEESIQVALMEVINNLMCGTIELKRAELIIRALNVAVKNSARVRVGIHASSMVREVPNYREPRPAAPAPTVPAPTKEELAAVIAAHTYPARVENADAKTAHVKTAHVGTGALARPGGPAVPVRSAVPATQTKASSEWEAALAAVPATPPQRKPAVSVPASVTQAPKERKNAARGASRG